MAYCRAGKQEYDFFQKRTQYRKGKNAKKFTKEFTLARMKGL